MIVFFPKNEFLVENLCRTIRSFVAKYPIYGVFCSYLEFFFLLSNLTNPGAYLGPWQASMLEFFGKNR